MLSKSTEAAIAAISRLAEVYGSERATLTAAEIASNRKLHKPFVAKLMTVLSQAGLIHGVPGPGGGYTLARPPAEISLANVVDCFERKATAVACPFGPDYCGDDAPCPLHDPLLELREHVRKFLEGTSLAVFVR